MEKIIKQDVEVLRGQTTITKKVEGTVRIGEDLTLLVVET